MKFEFKRSVVRLIAVAITFGPQLFFPGPLANGCPWLRSAFAQDELSARDQDSSAQSDAEDGPEFAARVGYATALGRVERGERIRNSMAGAIPLWVDVGYRLNKHWFIGAYGHYGLGIASATSDSDCPKCQHTWVRFGAQVQRRWLLDAELALWLGLGVGRESLNTSIDPLLSSSRSITGWELCNAQFGFDVRPMSGLSLGPYFSFSLDTYTEKNERCGDNLCPRAERNVTSGLDGSGLHSWVNAGVRVVLLP